MAESNALLPTGMMDQMPEQAEREAALCHKLQAVFAKFGYRLVNPPLLEFEDTLLAEGAGQALSTNTFRLMDPVSRRMMALRSDTTAQIARLAASRLETAQRPLRLSYITDVLRINASQLRPERQFKQAGCEFIGDAKDCAIEIALLALLSLQEAGVKKITIDFTAPEILKKIIGDNAGYKDEIETACQRKDRDAFKALGGIGKILSSLDEMSGRAEDFIAKRKKLKIPTSLSKTLDELEKTIKDLKKALKAYGLDKNVSITVDPLEMRGFEYQSSPCFTLFASGVRGELGRGGSYVSTFGDHSENACGFTLYMDSVMRAAPEKRMDKSLLVDNKVDWATIHDLQNKGWNVIRASGKSSSISTTHILKNGKAEKR